MYSRLIITVALLGLAVSQGFSQEVITNDQLCDLKPSVIKTYNSPGGGLGYPFSKDFTGCSFIQGDVEFVSMITANHSINATARVLFRIEGFTTNYTIEPTDPARDGILQLLNTAVTDKRRVRVYYGNASGNPRSVIQVMLIRD